MPFYSSNIRYSCCVFSRGGGAILLILISTGIDYRTVPYEVDYKFMTEVVRAVRSFSVPFLPFLPFLSTYPSFFLRYYGVHFLRRRTIQPTNKSPKSYYCCTVRRSTVLGKGLVMSCILSSSGGGRKITTSLSLLNHISIIIIIGGSDQYWRL